MARAEDDELRPRGPGRGRPRPRAPTSVAEMYAQPIEAPRPRSSKMKMAALMADDDDDDDDARSKRVKTEDWAPVSISSQAGEPPPSASSLFHEMPTIIQSFAEERRREPVANGDATNGVANGDRSPAAIKSVYDLYFPGARAERDAKGATSNRSLKRKRRGGRRPDDMGATDLDLLRFGVDAAKLVPQGLVDRVDGHMSRAVLGKVVGNHVTNWCTRAGFAPGFLQEITTLLAAYYPCNYPALLDEVLAGFLFKRPEFVELLLPAMLEKMQKAGESVSTTKYPVADAVARMCGSRPSRTSPQAVARHDVACKTLLRCLLEHNSDKFVLSPWISACAAESSDSVLHSLWRVLLPYRPPIQDGKDVKTSLTVDDMNWQIEDPTQQIVELLAEEGKQRTCRLTCGFVEILLSDDHLKKHLVDSRSFLIPDCLERAFTHASSNWSESLLSEWMKRQRQQESGEIDVAGAFKELMAFLVCFTSKLSAKNSDWFDKHVLKFVLSPQCEASEQESILRTILQDYMPFVLGGAAGQLLEQKSKQNGAGGVSVATNGSTWEELETVGSQSVLDVKSKIELLFSVLSVASPRSNALFVDIWSEVWSDKATLPWGCVHGLLCVTIQDLAEREDDLSTLGHKLQKFTTRVCGSYYRRLGHLTKVEAYGDATVKFSEALNLLLPSTRSIAVVLLQEIVSALAKFEQNHLGDASAVFGNAITLHLGSYDDDGMDISVKRSVVQKPLVDYDRIPADPASDTTSLNALTAFAPILAALKALASTKDDTGDFVRSVLSTRSVARLLAGLLNFGRRRYRQEMLLDVMNLVVSWNTPAKNTNWARQHVVQEILHCAYTAPSSIVRKAMLLLQNIFRYSTNSVRPLLWVVLQQCTELCCGRETTGKIDVCILEIDNFQGKSDTFAELLKAMLITVSASTVREVLGFVEQKLASCSVGKTRMNLFLLLLLRKLVVSELQCGVLLPVVQLAVCPLAPSDLDQIRLIQLQILKALCSRLITAKHRSSLPKRVRGYACADADWKRCEDLVCSERLQSDLLSLVRVAPLIYDGIYYKSEQTSRASEVLAQGILTFINQLKQQQNLIDEEDEAQRLLKKGRVK